MTQRVRSASMAKPVPSKKFISANSVARALVQIGDRWSLLILGSAFKGVKQFGEWREKIGISSNILSSRLARLVKIGCFKKVSSAGSVHQSYQLSEMGSQLFATALMFWRFDRLWTQKRTYQSGTLEHTVCSEPMTPMLVCRQCRAPVLASDVRYADGPGATLERLPPPKSTRRSNITMNEMTSVSTLFGDSVDIFGDRWTQLVLASYFLGDRRFEDIRSRWHIATNILADRLKLLVENGMLQRRVYQSNPERSEYILTPKGRDVFPIIMTLAQWGDHWLSTKAGPPMVLTHTKCGAVLETIVVCDICGGELNMHEVFFKAKG